MRPANVARRGLRPGNPAPLASASGAASADAIRVPPSKSLLQRALVLAGVCAEPVWIAGAGPSAAADSLSGAAEDVARARQAVLDLGARLDTPIPGTLRVRGNAPGPGRGPTTNTLVRLGESGTLARLLSAVVGLCGEAGRPVELSAQGSLGSRSSPPLFAALRKAGVGLEHVGRADGFSVRIRPVGPPSRLELVDPISSQELSALLCAAAAWPDAIEVLVRGAIPSAPYVAMTERMLARFGVVIDVQLAAADSTSSFLVRGPLRAPQPTLALEPDASAAAVLLAAACIRQASARVEGLHADSLQGDARIVDHLRAFGCDAGFDARGAFASGEPRRGVELDLRGEPDLAPVLAAVAAAAALRHGASSTLAGLETLQRKESARIDVLAEGLARTGFDVRAGADRLSIAPPRSAARGATLDPRGDHRMVFAFALLGLVIDGVDVTDPDCVAKSWPAFWRDCAAAGHRVVSDA